MPGNVALWRFDESMSILRPRDAVGNVGDLDIAGALTTPLVVDAATGFGRSFGGTAGLVGVDVVSGTTLLTRACSVQAILQWDVAGQAALGLGTLYARGRGSSAAEYVGAGIELRVVNLAARVGEIRWLWHTTAGVLKTQVGGHFKIPTDPNGNPSGFVLLTATRRWVSSSEVVLRYFVGDILIAEVVSADGDIGGGTTGTTQIGARWTGAVYANQLVGIVDELRVVDYELAAEEVQATWRRIFELQPLGYQLIQDSHPPGMPMSRDPSSRLQRESRLWGHALGYAAAQGENIRDNILPDRAYGDILERWEAIARVPRAGVGDVERRRARVIGKIAARAGVSIPGVEAALEELLDSDPSTWSMLAFDNTIRDDFATVINTAMWRVDAGGGGSWSVLAGQARAQAAAAADISFAARNWMRIVVPADGDGRLAHAIVKLTPSTIPAGAEAGIVLFDWPKENYIFFGIRNNAGTLQVVSERYLNNVSGGVTVHSATTAIAHWIQLFSTVDAGAATTYLGRWSTVGFTAGVTEVVAHASHPSSVQCAALYTRASVASLPSLVDARFDDFAIRAPRGTRTFFFYVIRPTTPGAPDYVGANMVIRALRQGHTHAAVVPDAILSCDTDGEGCDRGPMGGL